MPIRFRCPMCDGLLSIARRKAGSQVVCPRCEFDVTVPDADPAVGGGTAGSEAGNGSGLKLADWVPPPDKPAPTARPELAAKVRRPATQPLFEKDLAELLDPPEGAPAADRAGPPQTAPTPAPPLPTEDGITVSRGTAVVLVVLVAVLLAMAFVTGYLAAS